ncbi:phosphatase PAP2 family protein [Pedobacter mendelii]|uniref:Aureobasidin A resistance protein n=1 Tax=Pedobacter mendelii TaxID=1908240 RepID=A0ABQ2BJY1_9SPHI|nr:phosphatase PAP2 family protein [Pedobacter mendelii]GGI25832.1 aureobasidin A resistance protein [Pedobacter mendelii]
MQKNMIPGNSFYQLKTIIITSIISLSYLFLSFILVGFKTDQLILLLIFNSLFYISSATRKFILGFSIFIVYWILFDYMKAFPNYLFNRVHIEDLYQMEKKLFGINFDGLLITPNEYWKLNTNDFLDVITGFFYLMWIPVPLIFATYLFFKNKKQFVYFSLTFVWVNLLGFAIYYAFPAAPPWYVQEHGFKFIAKTAGNTGGLVRFDHYFNIRLFKGIYSKGSNVFAAMPSLHSAYPIIVFYYSIKNRLGIINLFFATVMFGIWFAAVYNSHHYVLDVLIGIICSIIAIITFDLLLSVKLFKNCIDKLIFEIK